MQRLLPDPAEIDLEEQIAALGHRERAPEGRPFVYTNFAATVDGHASIEGRSGAIGSDTDTRMLMALRESADAVLVGAGTIRAERYGRLLPDRERRERRRRDGRDPDPVAAVLSDSLELPWDAGLFTSGAGRVIVFTSSDRAAPATETDLELVRHRESVELGRALAYLREEVGVRALLCEGGPGLHGALAEGGLLDELFLTVAPILAGGEGPRIVEGLEAGPLSLELLWLLREEGELYARYAVRG